MADVITYMYMMVASLVGERRAGSNSEADIDGLPRKFTYRYVMVLWADCVRRLSLSSDKKRLSELMTSRQHTRHLKWMEIRCPMPHQCYDGA